MNAILLSLWLQNMMVLMNLSLKNFVLRQTHQTIDNATTWVGFATNTTFCATLKTGSVKVYWQLFGYISSKTGRVIQELRWPDTFPNT